MKGLTFEGVVTLEKKLTKKGLELQEFTGRNTPTGVLYTHRITTFSTEHDGHPITSSSSQSITHVVGERIEHEVDSDGNVTKGFVVKRHRLSMGL